MCALDEQKQFSQNLNINHTSFISIFITIHVTVPLTFKSTVSLTIIVKALYRYSNRNYIPLLNKLYIYALTYWQYSGNFYTAFVTKKSWNWSVLYSCLSHIWLILLTATLISQSWLLRLRSSVFSWLSLLFRLYVSAYFSRLLTAN
jgi:hypothetical protein